MSDERVRVGSVTEEALKLIGALQDWAHDGAGDASATATDRLHELNEHVATGGADCRYCPLCRAIAAARETSPDVKEHLVSAATSLLHAATGLLEASAIYERSKPTPTDGRNGAGPRDRARQYPRPHRRDPVEKIDLDDGAEQEDEERWV